MTHACVPLVRKPDRGLGTAVSDFFVCVSDFPLCAHTAGRYAVRSHHGLFIHDDIWGLIVSRAGLTWCRPDNTPVGMPVDRPNEFAVVPAGGSC